MFPMEAIEADPPNVWLTSDYAFHPEEWGMLAFSEEWRRRHFTENTLPGVLVVVYGAGKAPTEQRQRILGVMQCSHRLGRAEDFLSPPAWQKKQSVPEYAARWNYGVGIERAWQVTAETRMAVQEFAPDATGSKAWQYIGASGVPLSREEALNILKLDLREVDVYGNTPIIASAPGSATEILTPSRAGPVSQTSFVTRESEGPKHLYLLKLNGDNDAFLGDNAGGRVIVKAGFSRSPQTRCDDHNRTLPECCAYRWEVLRSGIASGYEPHPSSGHAKAGERAMQTVLCRHPAGRSLGGEFFLAAPDLIEEAWEKGNLAATEFRK